MAIVLTACAYLVGAIPFALLVARANGVDLRAVGSGNPGATNVARALGARWGAVALALDVLKGFLPVAFLPRLADAPSDLLRVAIAAAAVLGHVFPVYLRFRGGKGVATGSGVFLGLAPVATLIAAGVFLATVLATRFVSLGSIVAALSLPIAIALLDPARATGEGLAVLLAAIVLAALVVVRHRANIARLGRGEEPRFRFGGRAA